MATDLYLEAMREAMRELELGQGRPRTGPGRSGTPEAEAELQAALEALVSRMGLYQGAGDFGPPIDADERPMQPPPAPRPNLGAVARSVVGAYYGPERIRQRAVGSDVADIMTRNPTWGGLEEDAVRVGLGGRPRPVRRPQAARGPRPRLGMRGRMMPDGGYQGQAQRQRPNPSNAWRTVAAAMIARPARRKQPWRAGVGGGPFAL